ncbi:endonuclease [Patescibacteria group bacterium]|nr:MAG: endonuclease [Patescibacteria group bacterium]
MRMRPEKVGMNARKVYKHLFKKYGPQGWWPLCHSDRAKRVEESLFEIAVGAILTQSTAWRNVAVAIANLDKAKALTPKAIIKMPKARLCKLIKPAGYFNQKCKKLKIFAKWLMENCGGDVLSLRGAKRRSNPLEIRNKLLSIWGIGKETADSIILYALNKPIFVIDAYTRRLCAKFSIKFKEYDEYREFFEMSLRGAQRRSNPKRLSRGLLRPDGLAMTYQEYHALIVASGKDKHKYVL